MFGSVYWKLNKDTSNLPIIFQNAVIRLSALDEKVDFRTELSDHMLCYVICLYVEQKRVIRLVCKTGYLEHTAELFKSLYVLPFYDLVKYKIAIFMYKVFHKTLPMTVLMLFMQNHSSYRTRQSKNFS